MFKFQILKTTVLFFFLSSSAYAASCVSGCGDSSVSINRNLSSDENSTGMSLDSNAITLPEKRIRHSAGGEQSWGRYAGGVIPPAGSYQTDWTYSKIDDYVSIAISSIAPCSGRRYYPKNTRVGRASDCSDIIFTEGEITHSNTTQVEARLRIDKKIVSGVYSKNILLIELGRCQPIGCASQQIVTDRIFVNVSITVPQSCEINTGQVVNINFGNISSGAFKTAGASAQGIQPISRDISIKCDNISGNSKLTLRLEADKPNGNMIVSDENNDVGFLLTNTSGVPLIPNNLSSFIPFTLDSDARQNVTIKAYPVSITGNKPTEGPVTSRGYLRVDFP
ncbi:fimbrial protein [Pantoea ananatis]|uniref:fimbrial protein n=1 Tax=Pantoea ananas TaxID=553 RepID=UPI001C8A6A5A|nr:fimbrial protein [Pantoea ananatis]QZE31374.1 fimbrial protein [Pantoea ananatis]